jgi:murein DD-endopeptidase MepM/ murein hydrolase activator NlpD
LQKPTDGAPDLTETRRTTHRQASVTARLNRRSVRIARSVQAWLAGRARGPVGSLSTSLGRALRPFTSAERALPVAVAAIVAIASLLALLPGTPAGAAGAAQGQGQDVRLAVGGGLDRSNDTLSGPESVDTGPVTIDAAVGAAAPSFRPVTLPKDVSTQPGSVQSSVEPGNFLADGTLLTGYAPDTNVVDGADLVQLYKVKSGDTLVTIARHFGVSMMTLWWANKLPSKDQLHVGQVLRIPPVSGLVVTVAETDTLDSLAATYGVSSARIVELNGLTDPTLVVGQVLVIPGAKGAPIPTPPPTPRPAARPAAPPSSRSASSHVSSRGAPASYSGGRFAWPVAGGNNYISQYFHAGHGAIDIAGDYGTPIVAAGSGLVVFAGWKSNGGGWQVWISHGGGLYTTYNHMSALTVHSGQSVGRGQQVGRLGMSGNATGPHLHFEVWVGGMPWAGGTQVNPMRYM